MPQQSGGAAAPAIPAIPGVNFSALQLEVLQHRRELLSDQYQTAMAERGRVGQERLNAQARGDAAMVREYEGVIARTGARMEELERSIQAVDRQIDEAMKRPVEAEAIAPGAPGEPVTVTVTPPMPFAEELIAQRQEFQRMMAIEGVVLLLVAAVMWRFGVARGRRQAVRVEPPRDETRLQQAVDAIAIEVERLSESQRFINNVLAGRRPEREGVPAQPLPVSPLPKTEPRDSAWITPH
jgi:hypothetical protein